MGKRGKRASKAKKQQVKSGPSSSLDPSPRHADSEKCEVLRRCPRFGSAYEPPARSVSQEKIQELKQEVLDALRQIYTEYLNDFVQRKEKRLASKNPLDQAPQYNLVVEISYRKQLAQKVKQLVRLDTSHDLLKLFNDCVNNFVEQLLQVLKSLEGKSRMLQVVCLDEAYHTLQNAASEIDKITYCMFEHYPSCEYINKILFYEKVILYFRDLVDFAKDQGNKHPAAVSLIKCEVDLRQLTEHQNLHLTQKIVKRHFREDNLRRNLEDCDLSTHDGYNESSSDNEEEIRHEATHNMTVDELVSFINGDCRPSKNSRKRQRQKKRKEESDVSTAASSSSPYRETEIPSDADKEIEEFQSKLEQLRISHTRLKLRVSQEWINSLRSAIRTKLRS
jgi:hypothetical protein